MSRAAPSRAEGSGRSSWRGRGRIALRRSLRAVGRLRAAWIADDLARPAWQGWCWAVLLVGTCAWVVFKLGATEWYTGYPLILPDGRAVPLPDTFASIDHPFHIARERATVDALRAGRLPAWFAYHQGGYPAEFYPTGGAVIVALLYLAALGSIPLAVVHKLVLIGVFLLPPLAYWAIARRERLPGSVALLAAILHLFVRGTWVAGGSRELLDYGLWPDTLASYLPLFVILWGADWLRRGDRRGLILATLCAALALYTNPRSALGLAAAGLALGVVALSEMLPRWPVVLPWRRAGAGATAAGAGGRGRAWRAVQWPPLLLLWRGGVLAAIVGLLAAALLLPLRENQALYEFTIFVRFETIGQVWSNPVQGDGVGFIESVLPPIIALAGVGMIVAILRRGFYGRVFAVLLPLSYLLIALVGWTWQGLPVFAQLEGPRLMTILRPATIFLAALGAHEAIRCVARLCRVPGGTVITGAATTAVALVILFAARVPLDREERGLPLNQTTDGAGFAAIARAAAVVQRETDAEDVLLVMGNPLSTHASFWLPALTGRTTYHSDHLWFWRDTDYATRGQLCFAPTDCAPERALDLDFLLRHGLTIVLVDPAWRAILADANSRTYLTRLDAGLPGGYAVYRVAAPPGPPNGFLRTSSGAVTALDVRPERLTATIAGDRAQEVQILINDFPRWRASVNGQPTPTRRTPDGYIGLAVPAGEARIDLRYTTSAANWLGRAGVALGLLSLVGVAAGPRLRRLRRVKATDERAT